MFTKRPGSNLAQPERSITARDRVQADYIQRFGAVLAPDTARGGLVLTPAGTFNVPCFGWSMGDICLSCSCCIVHHFDLYLGSRASETWGTARAESPINCVEPHEEHWRESCRRNPQRARPFSF